jgi:hypothetical protein
MVRRKTHARAAQRRTQPLSFEYERLTRARSHAHSGASAEALRSLGFPQPPPCAPSRAWSPMAGRTSYWRARSEKPCLPWFRHGRQHAPGRHHRGVAGELGSVGRGGGRRARPAACAVAAQQRQNGQQRQHTRSYGHLTPHALPASNGIPGEQLVQPVHPPELRAGVVNHVYDPVSGRREDESAPVVARDP